MKRTKVIEVSGDELISFCLDMTVSEFRKSGLKTDSDNITWHIKNTGDPDRGTFNEFVEKLVIEIEE